MVIASGEPNVSVMCTVVMPFLNGGSYIKEAVHSVMAQTFSDWELIVIDDGSTDGSRDFVEGVATQDHRIRLCRTSGRTGAATARNLGISSAAGRYVAFLDCDDIWLPEKLARQVAFMQTHGLAFSWSSYMVIDSQGNSLRVQQAAEECSYFDLLTKRAVIGCLTAIYDRSLINTQLMPNIRMRQDYGLWLRLLRICKTRGLAARGLRESLAKYRLHAGAMTSNKFRAAWYQWRLYRDVEELSVFLSVYCLASYFFRGIGNRLTLP
jgi:teichuronic acid biosynthesis glycosyltransferase TuaG